MKVRNKGESPNGESGETRREFIKKTTGGKNTERKTRVAKKWAEDSAILSQSPAFIFVVL